MFGIRTQQGGEAGWTAISRDPPVYASLSLELHVHFILPGSLSNFSLSLSPQYPLPCLLGSRGKTQVLMIAKQAFTDSSPHLLSK